MDDRFDQEFYRSEWQRVLAAGPEGIQPYIHTPRAPRLARPHVDRLIARLGAVARRVIAFGLARMATRPMPSEARPRLRPRRSSPRLVHATVRPIARQTQAPRRPPRAA
jgi:hypothetical protein